VSCKSATKPSTPDRCRARASQCALTHLQGKGLCNQTASRSNPTGTPTWGFCEELNFLLRCCG
jgi:hypothetical protein